MQRLRVIMTGTIMAGAAIVVLALPVSNALASRYLTNKEARSSAIQAVNNSFAGFTEGRPKTSANCKRLSRDKMVCRVRYHGDRLQAEVVVSVRERTYDYYVRFESMKKL